MEYYEAHIESDLLLIWHDVDENTIALLRIGSHSKLFRKKKGKNK
jgi:addiction module RelE/StbE family toxin